MKLKNLSIDHHAFLVSLEGQVERGEVIRSLEKNIESLLPNETILFQSFEKEFFTIELARQAKAAQESKTLKHEHRFIFISFSSISPQAQNSLLKSLEEPARNTYFFIVVPNRSLILETVRSRCVDVEVCLEKTDPELEVDSFLKKSPKDRLGVVKELVDDKSKIDRFFADLEKEISTNLNNLGSAVGRTSELLSRSKYYSQNSNPATKYLLEELALTLPLL